MLAAAASRHHRHHLHWAARADSRQQRREHPALAGSRPGRRGAQATQRPVWGSFVGRGGSGHPGRRGKRGLLRRLPARRRPRGAPCLQHARLASPVVGAGHPGRFRQRAGCRRGDEPGLQGADPALPAIAVEESAEKLGAYVYTGGALISEAAPGRFDEHGIIRRGELSPVMSNLFGVRQAGLSMIREPGGRTQRWMPEERGWGEFLEPGTLDGAGPLNGQSVPANLYVQTFECQGSQPVLKYNSRAAGTFRVGVRGMAWLIGTCVGHSALAHRGPQTPAFVRQLLELCRVKPAHGGSLLLSKRAAGGKQAWFLTNPADEPVTETIDVGEAGVEDLLGEAFERSGSRVTLTVARLDGAGINLTIVANE